MIAGKKCLVLAAVLIAGCAGSIPVRVERPADTARESVAPPPPVDSRDAFRGIPAKYRAMAESAEKTGDMRRALLYRKVVNGFAPEDADSRGNVERLERKIRVQADRHYRTAMALDERGETGKALREFLAVLVLDPDHEEAFRRVKNGKNGKNGGVGTNSRIWKVREGDTLRKIAGEAYRDPDKEFLIAYFNGLSSSAPLPVGTGLLLPDIDTVSNTAEKVPAYSGPDKETNNHRGTVERKEISERKTREAAAHYEAGMRRFLAEDLDGAIREWGKTLSLDPSHPKARRDIEKARRLKGKIESPK